MPILQVNPGIQNAEKSKFPADDATIKRQKAAKNQTLIPLETLSKWREFHQKLEIEKGHLNVYLCECNPARFFRASELGISQEEHLKMNGII